MTAARSPRSGPPAGCRRSGGIFAEAAGEASARRERLPVDRWFGAVQDVKDAVFGLYDFLNGGGGKQKERLEFAEMEQAHQRVHVGRREEDAADGSAGGFAGRWRELRSRKDLRAEVGRGAEEEPDDTIGGESELRLRACGGLD